LGWISDRRGIPCISGTRITNAPQYLGGRFLARVVGAAGEGYARSQTTVTSSPLTGGATSAVTGDPAKFALGSLASGSSDELAQWIAERQAQNYDAVFVDTGEEVAIHVDRELPIDFEPHGRKLAYARKKRGQSAHVAALD
jgi:integrating conjugative element protein (TIGR03752 family)